tara:strand:+ start:404 stop:559 length:156 start_codon:yes stop_codon:yes gene_type:complete
MRFNTKDEFTYGGLIDLLNQLGQDQGYTTPEAWDEFLHDYCTYLICDGEGF